MAKSAYSNYTAKNTVSKKSTSNTSTKSPSKVSRSKASKPEGEEKEGLRKLLVDQMKDMLWAEKSLVKGIPKMIEKASSPELKDALSSHLEETKEQVNRLEQAFQTIDESATAKVCEAMKGLTKEAEELMEEMEEGNLRDAAIICAAQKVEHYEIASYGCLVAYARLLGETEATGLFEEILEEEKSADDTLSGVAEQINWKATVVTSDEESRL